MLERLTVTRLNPYRDRTIQRVHDFVAEKVALDKIPQVKLDNYAENVIDHLVVIKAKRDVKSRIQRLMMEGAVFVVYADHQGHGDAMGLAKTSGLFRKWAREVHCDFKGLVAPMAKSWESGAQGADLKDSYDLLKGGGKRKGFEWITVTRVADARYGMTQEHIFKEMRSFVKHLREGYGIADLPEGSVQGGRHPEGAKEDAINGMQEVKDDNLIGFIKLASREAVRTNRQVVCVPEGFHGSYRWVRTTGKEGDKPTLTKRGKLSLIIAAFANIPFVLSKMRATILMPYTIEDIEADLGSKWMEDVSTFNRYAMEKLKPGLPRKAWGFYGKPAEVKPSARAIELSTPS